MFDDPASKISRLTIGSVIPVLFTATFVAVVPLSVMGQSDETCIAYMEADALFEPDRRRHQAALGAADRATVELQAAIKVANHAKVVHAVRLSNASDPKYADLPDLTDHESAKHDLEIARAKLRTASDAHLEAYRALAAISDATKSASKKRSRAYLLAYKGPTSTVGCGPKTCGLDSVLAKLIEADRERCRLRLE